jgi:metal-dependent amidase/aminoacylase/carboxypeptidase family protein
MAVPTVLSFGKITADGATNVIPETALLAGTLRCFDETTRSAQHSKIKAICHDIATKHGGSCEVIILVGYPVLVNNAALTQQAKVAAENYLGSDNVHDLPIRMGAEDFAYYAQQVPACFYRIGVGNKERGITSPIHSPTFDIDETALEISMGLMAQIVVG